MSFHWSLRAAACLAAALFVTPAQPVKTTIGAGAGDYARLFTSLENMLLKAQRKQTVLGRERLVFVPWIRDQVHTTKAMKYLAPDVRSLLELYLETQTSDGLYFDYFEPLTRNTNLRLNAFERRYWHIFPRENLQMVRLPVEADLEYLLVEGVYYYWQSTGDKAFLAKWVPALERGMAYAMTDPLRWSKKYLLVKRGYTIDTWDFLQLPKPRTEYTSGEELQSGIFNIGPGTPMGIMHGDNTGMYAGCVQLAAMQRALGDELAAKAWEAQAETLRHRMNRVLWNGKFYSHFVEDDPKPSYLKADLRNQLSLSNAYDVNRGVPTEPMAESIVQTYLDLKRQAEGKSFAEWYGLYPPVEPDYAGYAPGTYTNGGILTCVAGELAKAAFQHGFEEYGADILRRVLALVDKHDGTLPHTYRPDGTVDRGIPDNWGQAAIYSAIVEGLAGLVDRGVLFEHAEVSPRWMAAGVKDVDVTIAYGPSSKKVTYNYRQDEAKRTITLRLDGDAARYTVRLMVPNASVQALVDGKETASRVEQLRNTRYVVLDAVAGGPRTVSVRY